MTEPFKHPPSHLDVESPQFRDKPHLWLQWKGTDVCCDIHCKCGAHLHFDGYFLYFFKCPFCNQVWEAGTHVNIYPVDIEKDVRFNQPGGGPIIQELEDFQETKQ